MSFPSSGISLPSTPEAWGDKTEGEERQKTPGINSITTHFTVVDGLWSVRSTQWAHLHLNSFCTWTNRVGCNYFNQITFSVN